jgi:hypothetical protein
MSSGGEEAWLRGGGGRRSRSNLGSPAITSTAAFPPMPIRVYCSTRSCPGCFERVSGRTACVALFANHQADRARYTDPVLIDAG